LFLFHLVAHIVDLGAEFIKAANLQGRLS